LIPRHVKTADVDALPTDQAWHARLCQSLSVSRKLGVDGLFSSDVMIAEPAQKQALHHSCDAVAVDMESAAIAIVAQQAHTPFMVIRAIVDDANTAIPSCINSAMDPYGNINSARMAAVLCMHPSIWPRLLRLGRQFKSARSTLSLVATGADADFFAFSGDAER